MSNDLNVKVDATTTGYEAAIARAERATKTFEYALRQAARAEQQAAQHERDLAAAMQRQHDAMDKAGKAAFTFGAAIAAGLALAVNEAVKWESAWTGVTKTVDGSGAEMERLEDGLRRLTLTLPATHEEIAAVAEAAGQLGISREAILGFTKTMIDLSETTNLTADQAATDMARFANIMGTAHDDIDRLGASLVALGNDGASTEADILSMAMRIAGAGAQLKLTEGEVMGLANALSSVGIEAEAGGSAISTVMKEIQTDVATGAARLEDFARVAGMSAEEFSALWRQDAAAGLNAFITGLGRISAEGGDTIKTLHDLEITEIRQSDAILRLAGAGDLLTDSLTLGNDAWAENTALLEEAEKRYGTTEAKVQIARNALRDVAITTGETLLPALAAVATTLTDMLRAWGDLPGPLRTGATLLAAVTAAVALLSGAMLVAVPKIAAYRAALTSLEAGTLKTLGTRLSGLAGILAGPWGLAIGAGITALGIFAAKHGEAAREAEQTKARIESLTDALADNREEWENILKRETIDQLGDRGLLKDAKQLGIDLGLLTDAALGAGDAFEQLEAQAAAANKAGTLSDFGIDDSVQDRIDASREITKAEEDRAQGLASLMSRLREIRDENGKAIVGAEQKIEADEKAAGATKKAGDAQKGTSQAWKEGAEAAGELTEETKTLLEQMEELSGAYLNQRAAGRAVRDSLRDIRKALKEYVEENGSLRGAFKAGSKSGDDFAAMLDGLAQDYQKQINATLELTGSSQKTIEVYRRNRAALLEVADQLGMNRKEARAYVEELLGTPRDIRTQIEATGLGAAREGAAALNREMNNLDGKVAVLSVAIQTQGKLPKGATLAQYADGGFDSSGAYVERVPQIRRGGANVLWGELETGWEAYISGKPGMEGRNREVWAEAGRRLGLLPALRQAAVAGRSFGSGGFSGRGGGGVVSLAGMRIEGRVSFDEGFDGYLRAVVRDEGDADRRFFDERGGA